MFTPGQIVLWWRASPWGPACGIVTDVGAAWLTVLEETSFGKRPVKLHLPAFSAEHGPRVVGTVGRDGQPRFAAHSGATDG